MNNNEQKFFASLTTMKVNVGTPGNVRPLSLDATRTWTVNEVLGIAEISPEGYDMRVNGQPSSGNTPVLDGQTILLLAPVRGNLRSVPPTTTPPTPADGNAAASDVAASDVASSAPALAPANIKVNVGTPGNVRPVSLDGSKPWTVNEVLAFADIQSEGYDVRVNGRPATGTANVVDNETILLLAPVRGN